MEGISRHSDTRVPWAGGMTPRWRLFQSCQWQGPVMFHFTRGSCTLLSPAIKRGICLFVLLFVIFLQQMETITEINTGKSVETEYLWGSPSVQERLDIWRALGLLKKKNYGDFWSKDDWVIWVIALWQLLGGKEWNVRVWIWNVNHRVMFL